VVRSKSTAVARALNLIVGLLDTTSMFNRVTLLPILLALVFGTGKAQATPRPPQVCSRSIDGSLIEAAAQLDVDRVEELLRCGADPNYVLVNPVHITAAPVVFFALSSEEARHDPQRAKQTIEILVAAGAHLGPDDPVGMLLMANLTATGDTEPMTLWLEAGGTVNATGLKGVLFHGCRRELQSLDDYVPARAGCGRVFTRLEGGDPSRLCEERGGSGRPLFTERSCRNCTDAERSVRAYAAHLAVAAERARRWFA
jgi:hypothetical protein